MRVPLTGGRKGEGKFNGKYDGAFNEKETPIHQGLWEGKGLVKREGKAMNQPRGEGALQGKNGPNGILGKKKEPFHSGGRRNRRSRKKGEKWDLP